MLRVVVLLGVALGLGAAPAAAQPAQTPPTADGSGEAQGQGQMRNEVLADDAARSHFRVGELLYAEGRFGDAAREFEQAFFLSNRPALLYNAYVAYRDANDLQHAILVLAEYLRLTPPSEDTAVLERRLAAMRATQEAQMSAQTDVEEERRRLEEERRRFEEDAAAARARADAAEREVARQRSPVPWVIGGSGLALLAGAGVAAIIANGHIGDAESACPDHVCPTDGSVDLEAQRRSVRRPAITTDVLLGAGSVTLVAGARRAARRPRRRARGLGDLHRPRLHRHLLHPLLRPACARTNDSSWWRRWPWSRRPAAP